MHEAFVELNNVRTKIVTYGRWIEESPGNIKDVIILIPGNPGVTGFYDKFAQTLHEQSGIPVWCVGHAGHNFTDKADNVTFPKFETNKQLYGLKGQIEHKIDFFKKYVLSTAEGKVYLIGHSIGSYMALELLKDPEIKNKVKKAYFLFPTLEYMAKTPNGKFMNTFIRPIIPFVLLLAWIFTVLPSLISSFLLYIYMFIANIPWNLHNENIKQLIKPGILRRVFYLAYEELDLIFERNNEVIAENLSVIKFYYGKTDGWTPEILYKNLLKDNAEANVETTKINHTFIFNQSVDVANSVTNWIKTG